MLRSRSFLSLILLATACRPLTEASNAVVTLEVAAIPIVQGVYLSWQVVAAAARYDVRYRPSGDERWIEMPELDRDTRATELRQLPTHPIEIELAAIGADGVVLAASRTTAQPRTEYPSACAQLEQGAGQGSLVGFCSQDDLEAWLVRVGIERTALRCRGQPAPPTGVLPDCSYHLDGKPVLLARALGDRFASPFESPQADAIRRRLRAVLYDDHDPFRSTSAATWTPVVPALTGLVTNFVGAESFAIDVPDTPFITRVTWFDRVPSPRGIALYLEGHSLPAIEPGAATIDSLLALGWSVIAIDMPLEGRNAPDREALSPTADLTLHNVLIGRDAGGVHPIGQMLLPIKAVVDRLERTHRAAPVILVGRSGGGWSSYVYGALDRRIDAVVSVAGGVPVSRRLDPTLRSLGDYEQVAPELYDFAPHELLMAVAGRLGSLHVWSDADPCCYPMGADDPTVSWLRGTSRADHLVEVLVQQHDAHGLNAHGFAALRRFLQRLFP